jgi:hypothetical protein
LNNNNSAQSILPPELKKQKVHSFLERITLFKQIEILVFTIELRSKKMSLSGHFRTFSTDEGTSRDRYAPRDKLLALPF